MSTLAHYMAHPLEELPGEVVEAIDLDLTGRDGNERFPYTYANLTPAERTHARQLFPPNLDTVVVASNLPDND